MHKVKFWGRSFVDVTLYVFFGAILSLSFLNISSYLLAGWLMRPLGDDYGSLSAYHTSGLHWLLTYPHTVLTESGRYGQTAVGLIMYGGLGAKGLRLTALLSLIVFLGATITSIIAWQKCSHQVNKVFASATAGVFFLFYTLLSVTYPWSNGQMDNSFQDILWFPGYVTYTLPFCLLIILSALAVLYRERILKSKKLLSAIAVAAAFIGTFNEIIPVTYFAFAMLVLIYVILSNKFQITNIVKRVRQYTSFLAIGFGLIVGLLFNQTAPATTHRKDVLHVYAPIKQVVAHALTSTPQYINTYIIHGTPLLHRVILFILSCSIVAGIAVCIRPNILRISLTLKNMLLISGFSLAMTLITIFICFAAVFKGYGLAAYLTPRFEIFYNSWLCLFMISIGLLIGFLFTVSLSQVRDRYIGLSIVPGTAMVLLLLIALIVAPAVLNRIDGRYQTVALYSAEWQQQDTALRQAAAVHQHTVTIPVIDIGDRYNFTCGNNSPNNWLAVALENYYHIPEICKQEPQ